MASFSVASFTAAIANATYTGVPSGIALRGMCDIDLDWLFSCSGFLSTDGTISHGTGTEKYVDGAWVTAEAVVLTRKYVAYPDVTNYADGQTIDNFYFSAYFPSDGQYRFKLQLSKSGYADVVAYAGLYVYAYSTPSISAFNVLRCTAAGVSDEAGTYAKITATYAVSPIGDNNTKALTVKWRELGAEAWSDPDVINISALGYSDSVAATVLTGSFDATKSYEIRASLTDLLSTATNDKTLSTASALMHFSADKTQAAIGKYCEAGGPGFDVAKDAIFRDDVQFEHAPVFDDQPNSLKNIGAIAAEAIASPRGTHASGTYYLEKWTEVQNSDNTNLEPFAITGDAAGLIRGWTVKCAGWYQLNSQVKFNSGSTAATSTMYLIGVEAENVSGILDTRTAAQIDAMAINPCPLWVPATSAAVTNVAVSRCVYLPADAVVVVYCVIGANKNQEATASQSHFSIARMA